MKLCPIGVFAMLSKIPRVLWFVLLFLMISMLIVHINAFIAILLSAGVIAVCSLLALKPDYFGKYRVSRVYSVSSAFLAMGCVQVALETGSEHQTLSDLHEIAPVSQQQSTENAKADALRSVKSGKSDLQMSKARFQSGVEKRARENKASPSLSTASLGTEQKRIKNAIAQGKGYSARILPGAAYLPNSMSHLKAGLDAAINQVATTHSGCVSVANASYSEKYARGSTPAFLVSCVMAGKSFAFQSVFIREGAIVGTLP